MDSSNTQKSSFIGGMSPEFISKLINLRQNLEQRLLESEREKERQRELARAYIFEPINLADHAGSYNPMPLVFPIRVGALRDIAAVYFAASLIAYKVKLIDTRSDDTDRSKPSTLRNTPETYRISAPLPTTLKQMIAALLPNMKYSLKRWKDYHFKMVYWDLCSSDELLDSDWLDKIVWIPDGSINYGQTAENMLRCDKMIAIKKYRLACTYCFEDSVRGLASKLGNERLKQDLEQNKDRNPLLNYWYTILNSKSQDALDHEGIFKSVTKDLNFYAVHYLFDNLSGINRMHKQNIIGNTGNPLYLWHVLTNLNASEFDVVVKADGRRLLFCFANKPKFEEEMITIWRYMLDRMDDKKVVENLSSFQFIPDGNVGEEMNEGEKHREHMIQRMWELYCTNKTMKKNK